MVMGSSEIHGHLPGSPDRCTPPPLIAADHRGRDRIVVGVTTT